MLTNDEILIKIKHSIQEIREKLAHYHGDNVGLNKLQTALKKYLKSYARHLFNMPARSDQNIREALQAAQECYEIEDRLGFRENAAHTMHFISTCYFNLDKNQHNLERAFQWIHDASQLFPFCIDHLKWCSTVANEYIKYLEMTIFLLESQNKIQESISLYFALMRVHDLQKNFGKLYDVALQLFDIYAKRINMNFIKLHNADIEQIYEYFTAMAECIYQARKYTSVAKNSDQVYDRLIQKEKYLKVRMLDFREEVLKPIKPQNSVELQKLENWYLVAIKIYTQLNNNEALAIEYALIANLYYDCAIKDDQLKNEHYLSKMNRYAHASIDAGMPYFIPRMLRVSEIFEMYANYHIRYTPEIAFKSYHEALKFQETHCKDKRVPFFCLKGLGVCYAKFAEVRQACNVQYESYWFDVDADLQTAIKYFNEALLYFKDYLLDQNVRDDDCYNMLANCHYNLGLHYERKCSENIYRIEFVRIQNQYTIAIQYATKGNDIRLLGKIMRQLANFYYLHQYFDFAVELWRSAIDNNFKYLLRKNGPSQHLRSLQDQYDNILQTYFSTRTAARDAYNGLLKQLIQYGIELDSFMPKITKRDVSDFLRQAMLASNTSTHLGEAFYSSNKNITQTMLGKRKY